MLPCLLVHDFFPQPSGMLVYTEGTISEVPRSFATTGVYHFTLVECALGIIAVGNGSGVIAVEMAE